jgi:hypothetical protein
MKRLILGLILTSIFPIAWIALPFLSKDNITICFFRQLFNKPCPFCGLTRAVAYATHGDLKAAFKYHPLWWFVATIIIGIITISFFDAIRGTNILGYLIKFYNTLPWVIIVGILVILTILRLFLFDTLPCTQ